MPESQPDGEENRKPLLPPKAGRKLAIFMAPLLFVAAAVAGYGHYTDPGPLPETKAFVIPRGNNATVTKALQDDGILSPTWSSGAFFRLSAFLTHRDGQIHAAELQFPARASVAHVLEILRHGKPVSHQLTVPEGLTALKIADILRKAPFLTGDVPQIVEGSVLPQTIAYVRGTARQSMVDRLKRMMDVQVQSIWDKRDVEALDGLIQNPQDLVTLASLIERETAVPTERPMVARVFLNRLKLGMRLQTDPSVIYGLSEGLGTLDRPLTHDDLQVSGPYNTYLEAGLPPGPICSPGKTSLEAAAHPAEGKALYFVATGEGGHSFSETLQEQDRNIRAYREKIPVVPQ
ncbi:endolytic transglycosylase MltG [Gluconobacter cerinus]|uniref:endolytic transglycosylase MltG n=1 Tax=Gluconobacter cerinus TaxID=38307 RepID=UPI001B8CCB9F|nr:endolytic transglycosylase MltG [Gluconobacter cerinus]MBS1069294.1 endolytic transglycosylase MltG [Gluconobacter cerinus]